MVLHAGCSSQHTSLSPDGNRVGEVACTALAQLIIQTKHGEVETFKASCCLRVCLSLCHCVCTCLWLSVYTPMSVCECFYRDLECVCPYFYQSICLYVYAATRMTVKYVCVLLFLPAFKEKENTLQNLCEFRSNYHSTFNKKIFQGTENSSAKRYLFQFKC